jgi:hypothetical protein
MAIDVEALRAMPVHTVETRLRSPRGVSEYVFRGALLFDYAREAGLLGDGPSANQYFYVTAGDGFRVAVAMAEVAPDFSSKTVLLAYEQNGEAIRAGARLVVPGDDLGGRSVYGVESIEVRSVQSPPLSEWGTSDAVEIRGDCENPGRLTRDTLASMSQETVDPAPSKGHGDTMRPQRRFSGVPVWSLMEAAGPRLDAAVNEDILHKIVVARDSEGYGVVIAAGELEPRFEATPFLVGLSDENGALGEDDGGLRLVAPYDLAGARHLKGLSILEWRDA